VLDPRHRQEDPLRLLGRPLRGLLVQQPPLLQLLPSLRRSLDTLPVIDLIFPHLPSNLLIS